MPGIAKARLEPEKGKKIECMFNPVTLKISKTSTWDASKAWKKNAPDLVFKRGESGTLGVELTLDTTDTGKPVTDHTDAILNLMKVQSLPGSGKDAKTKIDRPPWVRFCWGRTYSFKSVVQSANITFTYFSSEGKPLRATADLTLLQYEDDNGKEWPLQNPTSHTPELHRLHTIKAGETLDRIAHQHYGDSTLWKVIAQTNQILDPLDLTVGTHLQIPEQEAVINAG